jgi:hypothetical protein
VFCKICNSQTKYRPSHFLRYHCGPDHGITSKKEYYDLTEKKDGEGICVVCGKPTKFHQKGYARTCSVKCSHKDPEYIVNHKRSVNSYDKEKALSKRKTTNLKKYGKEHVPQLVDTKNKVAHTNLKNFGVKTNLLTEETTNLRVKALEENKEEINEKRRKSWTDEKKTSANVKRRNTNMNVYGVPATSCLKEIKDAIRKNMEDAGKWQPRSKMPEIKKYYLDVKRETLQSLNEVFELWSGYCEYTGFPLYKFPEHISIDHRESISNGFKRKASPEEIGSPSNLAIVHGKINSSKNSMNEDEYLKSDRFKTYMETFVIAAFEDYEIETENGWVEFEGLKKSDVKKAGICLTTNCDKTITTTFDHEIFSGDKTIQMKDLQVGDIIDTIDGPEKIVSIEYKGKEYVYDVLEVDNDEHSFYANGIKTHNCQFQGSSITLIEAEYIIKHLNKKEPLWMPDEWTKMWAQSKPGHKYAISVDVGGGVGSDFSIINVFDVTGALAGMAHEQVAIWRCNTLPPTQMAEYIYNSAKYWNDAYVIIEVNPGGYGDDVCASMFNDYEYENLFFDVQRGEYGVLATRSTKPKACQHFKADLEGGHIILNDDQTIDEIGYFEEVREGVFKGKEGKNLYDDCVMSCIWFSYFLHSDFFEGEKYEWQEKDMLQNDPELWYRMNKTNPQETPLQEAEGDPEMEEAWDAFLAADAEAHDPDGWLLDSEVRDFQSKINEFGGYEEYLNFRNGRR